MIVILGAMESEIAAFLTLLQNKQSQTRHGIEEHRGQLAGKEVLVSRSGVGKAMAAMRAQHFIDTLQPEALLFTGLAGSLRPHIAIGDTVLARDLVQHDFTGIEDNHPRGEIPFTGLRYLNTDPELLKIASSFVSAEGKVHLGRICTGDQFISHRDLTSHAYLVHELEGDAVEMEGAAIALVCTLNQIPFLVARTISDEANGAAAVSFAEFLPRASDNSLALVQHILAAL